MITKDNIEEIFRALNRQIEIREGDSISIVVCGGSALSAMGYILRTTRDVDILCEVIKKGDDIRLKRLDKLPSFLKEAAEVVRRDFNLPENWLNTGPASQMITNLPEGFKERLIERNYGKYLTVYYISRLDQIHFKFYASLDRGGYHVDDLFALNPNNEEIERATRWVLTQDVSEGFKIIVKDFLKKKGYDGIARRI
jgi:hypothetical protein